MDLLHIDYDGINRAISHYRTTWERSDGERVAVIELRDACSRYLDVIDEADD